MIADFLIDREKLLVNLLALIVLHHFLQIGINPLWMKELVLFFLGLVVEDDPQSAMHEGDVFQMLLDDIRIEVRAAEDLFVGPKKDRRTTSAKRPNLRDWTLRLSTPIRLLVLVPVAMNSGDHLFGQRVDDRRSNPVQAAGSSIILVREFAAGVQDRQHNFQRGRLRLGMLLNRDATSVVLHRDRLAVLVQRHIDAIAFAGEMLIDRVIDDFPNQMVQPARIDATDIHCRSTTHGLQAFENLDVVAGVIRFLFRHESPRSVAGMNSLAL